MREEKIGILAIGEAHLNTKWSRNIEQIFGKRLKIIFSSLPNNPNVTGIAIVLNKNITESQNITTYEIIPGHVLIIEIFWYSNKCLSILSINLSKDQPKTALVINFDTPLSNLNPNYIKGVATLRQWLEMPAVSTFPNKDQNSALKKLQCINLPALEFVYSQLYCNPPLPTPTESQRKQHTKTELAEALLNWHLQQPESRSVGADTSMRHGHVLQTTEVEEIWSDIDQLLMPT